MTTDEFIILVYNNLKGEISDTDFSVLNNKSMSDPILATLRAEIEETWDLTNAEETVTSQTDKDRGFAKLLQSKKAEKPSESNAASRDNLRVERNIEIPDEVDQLPTSRSKFRVLRNVISGVAACFLLVFGGMWFLGNQSQTYDGGIAGKQIILKDNSIVDLAANSSLKVSSFGNTREMTLAGTANFKVISDPTKPFIVYTEATKTEVLGTEFLLTEVTNIDKTILQVSEGKVKFSSIDLSSNITVIAKESAELSKGNIAKIAPLPNLKSVRSSMLRYTEQSLPSVLEEIMIIFNISITYDKSTLESCNVSGVISAKDLDTAINSIAKQFQIVVEKDKTNWILRGGNCN